MCRQCCKGQFHTDSGVSRLNARRKGAATAIYCCSECSCTRPAKLPGELAIRRAGCCHYPCSPAPAASGRLLVACILLQLVSRLLGFRISSAGQSAGAQNRLTPGPGGCLRSALDKAEPSAGAFKDSSQGPCPKMKSMRSVAFRRVSGYVFLGSEGAKPCGEAVEGEDQRRV